MAGTMWDLEARAVADLVGGRGDPINVLTAEDIVAWRKATEPVIGLWLREMRTHKIEGAELIAAANKLLVKYADEPEPQPLKPGRPEPAEPDSASQPPQAGPEPPELPKAGPVAQSPEARVEMPQAPKVETPMAKPPAKPAPLKELDIPL